MLQRDTPTQKIHRIYRCAELVCRVSSKNIVPLLLGELNELPLISIYIHRMSSKPRELPLILAQVICTLVSLIFSIQGLNFNDPTDHVETFAGKMSVTRGEILDSSIPIDLDIDPYNMDLTTSRGFSNAIFQLLNVRPGGGHTSAPVCSTWVFMSRGSTLWSVASPLGRSDSESVRIRNLLAARAIVLLLIASAKSIFWILEQPATSIMYLHPLFQRLIALVPVRQFQMNMGEYGGLSKKPTILYRSS